jgi:hypothetical protein
MDRYAARAYLPRRTTDEVWLTTDIYLDDPEPSTFQ